MEENLNETPIVQNVVSASRERENVRFQKSARWSVITNVQMTMKPRKVWFVVSKESTILQQPESASSVDTDSSTHSNRSFA